MFSRYLLGLFIVISAVSTSQAQICNPNGNLVIFSNYEGGTLNINVDINIPNLRIGIVSYNATQINISGSFAANVSQVIYAGFDAPNTSCGPITVNSTGINGVPASIFTKYSYTDGNGAIANHLGDPLPGLNIPLVNCMVSADGTCDSTSSGGGGNSSPQIVQFFLAEFGPGTVLYAHNTSYACFSGVYNVSNSGNCCIEAPVTPPNPIYVSGDQYNFLPDDTTLCNGPVKLDLSFYPVLVQPPVYPGYVWSDGTTGPVITITAPGTYYVTVGDYCHYPGTELLTDTIVVKACCGVEAQAGNNSPFCFGENGLQLTSSNLQNDNIVSYAWTGPNGFISSDQNPAIPNANPALNGVYQVIMSTAYCADTATTTVNVYPSVNLSVTPTTQDVFIGSTVQLNATGAINYIWSPAAGLSNASSGNPIASPQQTTLYTVVGTNEFGCADTASVQINVDTGGEIIIPSAFSPNGDGRNDEFRPFMPGNYKLIEFRIYNRWGQQVFYDATGLTIKGWDGMYQNVLQQIGTYHYLMTIALPNGTNMTKKGDLTLVL